MNDEKIKIKAETGQVIDVVVLSKHANRIEVVIGEGVHSMRCALTPTRNEMAYVGRIMGREVVYERSKTQVQADIDRLDPRLKKSR
jgi:K+/H+ antiporter YhaU regulatory subunit KhtT